MAEVTCPRCGTDQQVQDSVRLVTCSSCESEFRFEQCPRCGAVNSVLRLWSSYTCFNCNFTGKIKALSADQKLEVVAGGFELLANIAKLAFLILILVFFWQCATAVNEDDGPRPGRRGAIESHL